MRTSARTTGAAAAIAAVALLVSGCGSSGDDGSSGGPGGSGGSDKPAEQPSAGQEQQPAEDGAEEAGPASLPGIWRTKAGGEDFVLTVAGDAVTLLRDGKTCTGRVVAAGDDDSLTLKCPGGIGEERTNGTVGELTAKTLTVEWNGGDTDTYTKLAEAPEALPKDPAELEKLLPTG